jgi:large subunit ribosomal protein L29
MKAKELRTIAAGELQAKLVELRKELMKQNAQIAAGTTPKSPGQIRHSKKTIARIITELKNRKVEPKHE